MAIETPCIRICTLDAQGRYCLGCGRTVDEIVNWLAFDHEQRARIMAALPQRLAAPAPAPKQPA